MANENLYTNLEQLELLAQRTKDAIPVNVSELENDSGYQTAAQVEAAINAKVASVFDYKGSIAFAQLLPALLIADNEGDVYNITDAFTSTADFTEGAGTKHPAGSNVVIVKTGTDESPVYKFDVMDRRQFLKRMTSATTLRLIYASCLAYPQLTNQRQGAKLMLPRIIKVPLETSFAFLCGFIGTLRDGLELLAQNKADVNAAVNFTIPTSGWGTDNTVPSHSNYIDIPVAGLLDTDIVEVNVAPESANTARSANFTVTQSYAGKFRLRAEKIPTAAISAQYHIIGTVAYSVNDEETEA